MNPPIARRCWFILCMLLLTLLLGIGAPAQAEAGQEPPKPPVTPQSGEIAAAWTEWRALPAAVQAKVDPRILAELRGETRPAHLSAYADDSMRRTLPAAARAQTRFLVLLHEQPDLDALDRRVYASAADRRTALVGELADLAQRSQAPVRTMLDDRLGWGSVSAYQPFSIVNALAVEGDLSTVAALAQRADVAQIVANYPLLRLWDERTAPEEPSLDSGPTAYPWNITASGANRVWNELGIRGDGAVVGGFDTGVRLRHPALLSAYRGYVDRNTIVHDYNWFEPDGALYANGNLGPSASTEPYDCDYSTHGTHTMGTMVGDGGSEDTSIGMAPGARWIAVPGICYTTMPGLSLADDIGGLKAFQWFLCPTDLTGDLSSADCSKAPDVINNSWGSANPVSDVFQPALQALRAAGTAVIFAAGNTGRPGSIGTPAHLPEAITVGAVDVWASNAYFSSQGPAFDNIELKPNLSAPGVDVLSSVGNGQYDYGSGTSMASPHVAGLVALLVAADLVDGVRDFDVDEIEAFMTATAFDLGQPGADYLFGAGTIDAYNAVRWLLGSGELTGVVTDSQDAMPQADVEIVGSNLDTGDVFTGTTDSQGFYSLSVPAGRYTIVLRHWAYETTTFANQRVVSGSLSTANFQLDPKQTALLTGTIQDAAGPVATTRVYLSTAPGIETITAADGSFTLSVPLGTHTVVVEARGHKVFERTIAVGVQGATLNADLVRAPSILLVNADASAGWFFGWPVHPFLEWALNEHGYLYDVWEIEYTDFVGRQEVADGSLAYGVPSAQTMLGYDVVIWAHSGCSGYGFLFTCTWSNPDTVHAVDELTTLLDAGGRLLISGQDIGSMDGDNNFYDLYLHADRLNDYAGYETTSISGVDFLEGLSLEITNASWYEAPNSAASLSPDAVASSGNAFPILNYADSNQAAALAVAPCNADYRAVYLAVGFENIAPLADKRSADMSAVIARSVEWLSSSAPIGNFQVAGTTNAQSGDAGTQQTYSLLVTNNSTFPLRLALSLSGQKWPVRIEDEDGVAVDAVSVDSCARRQLQVKVQIPDSVENGATDAVTLTISAPETQLAAKTQSFTTRMFPQWRTAASMPHPRHWLASTSLPDRPDIYLIGGFNQGTDEIVASVERYNPCVNKWTALASLPEAVASAAAEVIGNQIYVAGGTNNFDGQPSDRLWIYDIASDTWRAGAKLPLPLAYGVSAVWQDKLYLFGGTDSVFEYHGALIYDTVTDQWSEMGFLPVYASFLTLAATNWNDEIYFLVTDRPGEGLLIYNPATNIWRSGRGPKSGRYAAKLVAADEYLYLVGGYVSGVDQGMVERYDPVNDVWSTLSQLQNPDRVGAGVAAWADWLVVAGGGAAGVNTEVLQLQRNFCSSTVSALTPGIQAGQAFDLRIVLESGSRPLAQAQAIAPLPPELTFRGFVDNMPGATYNAAEHRVEWQGALPAGPPVSVTFTVQGSDAMPPNTQIDGTVHFEDAAGDRFDRSWRAIVLAADFSRSAKYAGAPTLLEGERLTYTIDLRSRTPVGGAASLSDALPAQLELIPGSLKSSTGTATFDPVRKLIAWAGVLVQAANAVVNVTDAYLWGDSDGEGEVGNVQVNWIDVSESGDFVLIGDDSILCNIPIGFDFPFHKDSYSSFCVSTNGYIAFGSSSGVISTSCPFPSSNSDIIAGHFQDLVVDDGIYVQTVGSAPDRKTIVQWHGARRYAVDAVPTIEFEIILSESGNVAVQILRTPVIRTSSTVVGVQSKKGVGSTYTCGERRLHDNLAIDFLAPGQTDQGVSAQVEYAASLVPGVAPNRVLTNTALIVTPDGTIERAATVQANPLHFDTSSVQASRAEIMVGEPFGYQFEIRNTGRVTATTAELTNVLPHELAYVPDSLICPVGTCDGGDNEVSWRGSVAPGQSVRVAFSATLGLSVRDRTIVTNTAQINDGYGGVTNIWTTIQARQAEFSASFVEVDPAIIFPGDLITYTIYLHNSGGQAAEVDMIHQLPPGMVYHPDSLWCGLGVCEMQADSLHWQGTLPTRAITPIRIQARLSPDLSVGDRLTSTLVIQRADRPLTFTLPVQISLAQQYFFPYLAKPSYWPVFMPQVHSDG